MAQELLSRALFEHVKRPNREAAVQQLPEDLQRRYRETISLDAKSLAEVISDPMRSLKMIHQSWYEDVLRCSPNALQGALKNLFSMSYGPLEKDRSPIAEFLLHYAIQHWPDCNKASVETLQNHPLYWILQLDAESVALLASLLAIHEIVDSVRKIVDKKTLHRVLCFLTPIQQRYLRSLLQRKSEGLSTKLSCQDLLKADESEAENLLLECGYGQLSFLLSGQDDLFYWHLYHRLDKKFAEQLQKRILNPKNLKNRDLDPAKFQDLQLETQPDSSTCLGIEAQSNQEKPILEKRLKSVHQFLNRGEWS